MPLLQWNDALSMGIDSIDEQHKILVGMINTLNDALLEGKANDIMGEIFDGLAEYTLTHFAYEENLLVESAYPEAESHKNEHQALIQQIESLKTRMATGDFLISVEVLAFLKEWLINHIMKTDKAYAPFLKKQGIN